MEEKKSWGGARKGAGRPRKYRYIKMQWNSKANEYIGTLPNGDEVHVDADVFGEAHAERAALLSGVADANDCSPEDAEQAYEDMLEPTQWENCADGETVRVVKK